ncbi:MAG: hypothetical protein ACRC0G_07190 [Fusobacteriaceae bacterium]
MKNINDFYEICNSEFEGTFNSDIIVNNRKSENLVDFIDKVAKTLEVLEYIKYIGYDLIEDEGDFDVHEICRHIGQTSDPTVSREISRLSLVKLYYTIEYGGETKDIVRNILIPKPSKMYLTINGNKIYPIYQIVDSSTYIMKNTLVLKTTMMPLRIKASIVNIKDIYGITYTARNFNVSLYKEIPLVSYYLATIGLSKTIKYMLGDNVLTIKKKDACLNYSNEEVITFGFGDNLIIIVDREIFNEQEYVRSIVSSMLCVVNAYCPGVLYEELNSITYWRNILGMMIYTKANKMRGKSLLILFERVFDEITKDILKVDDDKKAHTYAIVKWLTFNFDELMAKDNLSMENKRLRLSEYMVMPLNIRFSYSIQRLLDYNKRKMTIDSIDSALNVHPMIIVDAMVNSKNKSGINKLTRFCNTVNDMDIIPALKYSLTGPQSIGSGSSNSIPDSHRYIHPSHIGKVDILASSAGSPGTSGSLLPLGELSGMNFSDKPEPQKAESVYREYLQSKEIVIESIDLIPTVDVSKVKDPETCHTICTRNLDMRKEASIGIDSPFAEANIRDGESLGVCVIKYDVGNPNVI